ncbi:ROK family protein [Thermosipho atlanticus]|uniref:Sugar kinase of the NBD/HSP70 family, may contain an N-terminal HTH domain n=1 Tax=Thermosipho atlanticus DSM 15807 TaxID=1123380 RepID=A0A1M5SMF0_9BACT|nr:ROK family protein [Thermosipho atlanticus]SHH39684.1 Sugar kinase of the NBD/HSP70 family, may contain an N-terminal HTH domain [Thermosipho atlanticus DSM 15807]
MKLTNYKKILLNLLFKEKVYRNELINTLKITPSSLTYILNNLKKNKYISIFQENQRIAGRPKHFVKLYKDNWKSIGVRVGRESLGLTVFNGYFEELEKISIKLTKSDIGNENLPKVIKKIINKISSKEDIVAVGIAFSGKIIKNKVYSNILNLKDFEPKNIIKTLIPNATITIINDVEAIATEEFVKHGGKKILVINYGTGIGACFYESHGIYEKSERKVIELGHFHAGGSERCYCGLVGCLETVASDYANLKKYKYKNLNIKEFISNQENYENDLNEMRNLYKSYRKKAEELYKDTFDYLAIFISNMIKLLTPEKIILSGEGVSKWFVQNLEKKISSISLNPISITFSGLRNNIEYGASIDALREHILKLKF